MVAWLNGLRQSPVVAEASKKMFFTLLWMGKARKGPGASATKGGWQDGSSEDLSSAPEPTGKLASCTCSPGSGEVGSRDGGSLEMCWPTLLALWVKL